MSIFLAVTEQVISINTQEVYKTMVEYIGVGIQMKSLKYIIVYKI